MGFLSFSPFACKHSKPELLIIGYLLLEFQNELEIKFDPIPLEPITNNR